LRRYPGRTGLDDEIEQCVAGKGNFDRTAMRGMLKLYYHTVVWPADFCTLWDTQRPDISRR